MDTFGRHIVCELSGCDPNILVDVDAIRTAMVNAARIAKAEVREAVFHQFFPEGIAGVSGVVVLSESHISIHTWPKERYAAADIYTCGKQTDPQLACEFLAKALGATAKHLTAIERGLPNMTGQYEHVVTSKSLKPQSLAAAAA